MKKQLIIAGIFFIIATSGYAKFGIGGGGGIIYPGFSESSLYGSKFGLGGGFELFIRHTLLQLGDSLHIDARYSYRNYKADVNLPNTATTRFSFNYLGVGVFMKILNFSDFDLYAGGGVSLVTVQAAKDFFEITETLPMPEVSLGIEWNLSKYYNIFSQLDFQFGSIAVRDDVLPLHGFRLIIGGTMFLTE
jgi:hypothetical protein